MRIWDSSIKPNGREVMIEQIKLIYYHMEEIS